MDHTVTAANVAANTAVNTVANDAAITLGVGAAVVFTAILLFVSGRFDPTAGVLTISLLITLGMLGATAYCLIYTIPPDDITPGVVGALSAGFGAVVAHWLGRVSNGVPKE